MSAPHHYTPFVYTAPSNRNRMQAMCEILNVLLFKDKGQQIKFILITFYSAQYIKRNHFTG